MGVVSQGVVRAVFSWQLASRVAMSISAYRGISYKFFQSKRQLAGGNISVVILSGVEGWVKP